MKDRFVEGVMRFVNKIERREVVGYQAQCTGRYSTFLFPQKPRCDWRGREVLSENAGSIDMAYDSASSQARQHEADTQTEHPDDLGMGSGGYIYHVVNIKAVKR